MIKRILFIFVLCLLISVSFVNAETLTGTLGGTSISNPQWTYVGETQSGTNHNILILNTYDAEYTTGLKSLVHFSVWGAEVGGTRAGNTTRFIAKTGTHTWGSGTYGYQRLWNGATEIAGYQWWAFDSWNNTGQSGVKIITITLNDTIEAWGNGGRATGSFTPATTGNIWIGGGDSGKPARGNYLQLREITFYNSYIAEKPLGIGITGRINKTINGQAYNSRVYITDGVLNGIITSDTTLNSNDFLFGIVNQSIKINSLDSGGTWWNSTTLFLPTIPTVTQTTPVPTPTGVGFANDTTGTFYIRDGLNQTLLANTYVEAHYTNAFGDAAIMGYTDSVGKIIFAGLTNGEEYEVRLWKIGYQYSQYTFTATPVAFSKTFYMYPDTGTTTTLPSQINVTVRVMDKTSYTPVVGAYVVARDTLFGSFSTSALPTNATGYAVFMGVPNSANIGGTITKTGYVYQLWDIPYQAATGTFMPDGDVTVVVELTPVTAITPTGTIVTPTPTPVAIDKLSLLATPDSINLGQSVSLTGSCSNVTKLTYAGGLRQTLFYVNKNNPSRPFNDELIGVFYNVNATYWKFRANNSAAFETPTTASPLTLVNIPQTNGLYTYRFAAFDSIPQAIAQAASDDVLVGGGATGGSLTMVLFAVDGQTTSHLSNYQMNITDDNSGIVTEFGDVSYDKEMNLLRGNSYTLKASKENYVTTSPSGIKQFIVPVSASIVKGDMGTFIGVPLFPTGSISAGNTTVTVHVDDAETYYPLASVQVSIGGYQSQYTGLSGESVSFILPQNTAYTVSAMKNGYCTVSESKNTSTYTMMYVPLFMKFGACTGVKTPTPTPTQVGLTPTPTPIGGWGNLTGTAIVCGELPEGATFVDILKNGMACNGLKDVQSQNLGMAMMIILFAAIILGRIAKGVGVLAGVIAGTVLATVAGFLPFWIIIVVIIIAGLIFAGKVFWSSGQ